MSWCFRKSLIRYISVRTKADGWSAAHAPEAGITVWPVDGDPLRAQQRALKRLQALFVSPGGASVVFVAR